MADSHGSEPAVIGKVAAVGGTAWVVHDGERHILLADSPVFRGDTIGTEHGGQVALVFADRSTLVLKDRSAVALDEFVYDPAHPNHGNSQLSIGLGLFNFVSGDIAKTAPEATRLLTPALSIGIRGTTVAGAIASDGVTSVALLSDPGSHFIGEISVGHPGGGDSVVVNSEGAGIIGATASSALTVTANAADTLASVLPAPLPPPNAVPDLPAIPGHDVPGGHSEAPGGSELAATASSPVAGTDAGHATPSAATIVQLMPQGAEHDVFGQLVEAAPTLQIGQMVTYSVNPTTGHVTDVHTASERFSVNGQVVDGYVGGATVFADANHNGVLDAGEVWTTTDANGNFTLANAIGPIVVVGGTDLSTGLANTGVMTAPSGSSVVTPLTTMVEALVAADPTLTTASAMAAVKAGLGISGSVDLTSFDPVQAAMSSDAQTAATAKAVMAAGVMVENTAIESAALLTAAGMQNAQAVDASYSAIATNLAAGQDITQAATIHDIITAAAAQGQGANLAVVSAAADASAQVISASNVLMSGAASSSDGLAFLTQVAQIASVAQGAAAQAISQAASSGATGALIGNFTANALTTAVAEAGGNIGDVAPDSYQPSTDLVLTTSAGQTVLIGGPANATLIGATGNDTLYGGAANDTLIAGNGNNMLFGGGGVDTIIVAGGTDYINGRTGTDTVVLPGPRDQYELRYSGDQLVVIDLANPQNVDTLVNVDALRFSDATIMVTANTPPVAGNQSATVTENSPVSLHPLAGASDIDNNSLTLSGFSQPAHGTVTEVTGTTLLYTPTAQFSGLDSFTYTVSDGLGGTSTGVISVTVSHVDQAPVAANAAYATTWIAPVSGTLPGGDADSPALTYTIVANGAHGHVVITDPATGAFTYTPGITVADGDSFTYQVSDGTLTATGTIDLAIAAVPVTGTENADTITIGTGSYVVNALGGADTITIAGPAGAFSDVLDGGAGANLLILSYLGGASPAAFTSAGYSLVGGIYHYSFTDATGGSLEVSNFQQLRVGGATYVVPQAPGAMDPAGIAYNDGQALFTGWYNDIGAIWSTDNHTAYLLSSAGGNAAYFISTMYLPNDATIHGGGGDDYIVDTAGSNTIFGGGGNDHIALLYGSNDVVECGSGNDTILIDTSAILTQPGVIDGGGGTNTLDLTGLTHLANLTIDLATSTRFVNFEAITAPCTNYNGNFNYVVSNVVFYAGAGNDVISGGNTIFGGAGNDTLSYADTLFGGAGNDTLITGFHDSYVDGGPGTDLINLGQNTSHVDTVVLHADYGGATLAAADTVIGFVPGQDVFALADGLLFNGLALSQSGGDTVIQVAATGQYLAVVTGITPAQLDFSSFEIQTAAPLTVTGSGANDVIIGSQLGDTIYADGANDTVYGYGGDDSITIGGDKTGAFTSFVDGGSGTNTLTIAYGAIASLGDFSGGYAQDDGNYRYTLTDANGGTITFQNIATLVIGGAHYVVPQAPGAMDPAGIAYNDGQALFTGWYNDIGAIWSTDNHTAYLLSSAGGNAAYFISTMYLPNDATIHGGGGDDYIVDTAGSNTIFGGGGNDHIALMFGSNDVVECGAGNDIVQIGTSAILTQPGVIDGGGGTNTLDLLYLARIANLTIDLTTSTRFVDFENITAPCTNYNANFFYSATNVVLLGTDGDNVISGGNTIFGGDGNDTLSYADTMFGGAGNDTLITGFHDSYVDGGPGTDLINLGQNTSHVDTVVLRADYGGATLAAADTVIGFVPGQDVFALADGLLYSDLSISQGTAGAVIQYAATGQYLAVVEGVSAADLGYSAFEISSTATNGNSPPIAGGITAVSLSEGGVSAALAPTGVAEAGQTIADYVVVAAPSHGTLFLDANGNGVLDPGEALTAGDQISRAAVAGGELHYQGAAIYAGFDSAQFGVIDSLGEASVNTSTVELRIAAIEHAPVAAATTFTTNEGVAGSGALVATDIDGNALSYATLAGPSHGTLSAFDPATGVFTYTPNAGFSGTDSFTFEANDGQANSNVATVSVDVIAAIRPPTATAMTVTTDESVNIVGGQLNANDSGQGHALAYTVVDEPSKGTLAVNSTTGLFEYDPFPTVNGSDTFTYYVTDAATGQRSADAAVTIGITPEPTAPVVSAGAMLVLENTPATTFLVAMDPDNHPLTYAIVGAPDHGQITIVDAATGAFTYTPDTNYFGADSFTFSATDGVESLSSQAMVSLYVFGTQPNAVADTALAVENQTTTIMAQVLTANDVDPYGDLLHLTGVGGASHCTVSLDGNGDVTFTAAAGFTGIATFQYQVADSHGGVASATVSVDVLAPTVDAFGISHAASGGVELVYGTVGNDILPYDGTSFAAMVGDGGVDTLHFTAGGLDLDLTALNQTAYYGALLGVAEIDLGASGGNTLALDKNDVIGIAPGQTNPMLAGTSEAGHLNALVVSGDASDHVILGDDWTQLTPTPAQEISLSAAGAPAGLFNLYESTTQDALLAIDARVDVSHPITVSAVGGTVAVTDFQAGLDVFDVAGTGVSATLASNQFASAGPAHQMAAASYNFGGGSESGAGIVAIDDGGGGATIWYTSHLEAASLANSHELAHVNVDTSHLDNAQFHLGV